MGKQEEESDLGDSDVLLPVPAHGKLKHVSQKPHKQHFMKKKNQELCVFSYNFIFYLMLGRKTNLSFWGTGRGAPLPNRRL